MKKTLISLNACSAATEWEADKTWVEIYNTCHRGDWLLWLFKRTNPDDLQRLTLAKGHCAATVLHLMKDERSRKAVEVAIKFGEGLATREDLNNAAYAAAAARTKNQMETADICRKYLPIEIWNIK